MMDWQRLLSTRRFGRPGEEAGAPARTAFQKDWDRVVFSSAFRRLQDKTQVHSLPESDYVRTRLTHSMEVSSVGRSLGAAIGQVVIERQPRLAAQAQAADFGHIAAAACLAHDIGNPPFGHFGEDTIRHWFADPLGGAGFLAGLNPAERGDLLGFEGNAQGFRILTRLQNWRDEGGLRLTAATLATFTKYPRSATSPATGTPKFGIFQAEQPLFAAVAEAVGLPRREPGDDDAWCRHPLAYLVEAADDICYRVVDLEDGFKLGRIRFDEAEALLLALVGEAPPRYRSIQEAPRRIAYLRAKAIGRLVDAVVEVFLDREAALMAGAPEGELLRQTPQAAVLARIADLTAREVFETRERYEIEVAGVEILTVLLSSFAQAVFEPAAGGKRSPRARALLELLPEPPVQGPPYDRLLQITDYVSGMTDSYALTQFRRLKGLLAT